MKRNHVRLGPFALILAVITLCMAVLSVLSLSTALADMRLSEKYAETVSLRYELEYEGQKYLDSIRKDISLLTENATGDDGVYIVRFEKDRSVLLVGIRLNGSEPEVVYWKHQRLWEEENSINLGQGRGE